MGGHGLIIADGCGLGMGTNSKEMLGVVTTLNNLFSIT